LLEEKMPPSPMDGICEKPQPLNIAPRIPRPKTHKTAG
jgi:hypothetical protein